MFGRKKEAKKSPAPNARRREGGPRNLSQFGLIDVPNLDDLEGQNNDADLEAELKMLMYGGSEAKKHVPKKRAPKGPAEADLDSMIAACMRDIPSDEESSGDDDPGLLDELAGLQEDDEDEPLGSTLVTESRQAHSDIPAIVEPLSQPSNHCETSDCPGEDLLEKINGRISNYKTAETNAKNAGESARARRYGRALAKLNDLQARAMNGQAINDNDIPPPIVPSAPKILNNETETPSSSLNTSMNTSDTSDAEQTKSAASLPEPIVPTQVSKPDLSPKLDTHAQARSSDSSITTHYTKTQSTVNMVKKRREELKYLALEAKHSGDKARAVAGLKGVKECDALLAKLESGEISSIDKLPEFDSAAGVKNQETPGKVLVEQANQVNQDQVVDMNEENAQVDPSIFKAPPPPSTAMEALEQRLAKYREDEAKAKSEGNQSKVRRLGRICKQYTDAIKLHKAGRPVPFDDLPTPPGFGPIPRSDNVLPKDAVGATMKFPQQANSAQKLPAAVSAQVPETAKRPASDAVPAASASPPRKPSTGPKSLREKQIIQLEKMQSQFKEAALQAKKAGQMEQAKEYLRQFKGFDKVIEAAKCGLPVDFKTLPVPPQRQSGASMDFEIVSKEDCSPSIMPGDRKEMFSKLETDLISQVKMCARNSEHFRATGDVPSANKFQQMMEHTKKDLDALRFAFKRGDDVPKFHYEVRSFSRVVCNSDLNDVDLEFSVLRGINYVIPNPKDAHTYCKIEFPYPKENPFKDKSAIVKESNNPNYNFKSIIPVNPKDKYYQRIFKRQSAKVEIWNKVGFLRSDALIGTAQIKLQDLETKCTIHDSFALMDGRKPVGGKVEVQIRIRNPILTKQVEKVEEKWLVIRYQ